MPTPLICTECGARGEGSCECGAPYSPVQKAIIKGPGKSDRLIAAELGVGSNTVRRARQKTTAPSGGAVETRIGKDGKRRRMPKTGPKAGARIGITKPSRRRVKGPPSGVPLSQQLNNLMWQLSKFREDWVATAKDFNRDHIDSNEYRAALARCAASNALALKELAEALQEESGQHKGNGHDKEARTLHS